MDGARECPPRSRRLEPAPKASDAAAPSEASASAKRPPAIVAV